MDEIIEILMYQYSVSECSAKLMLEDAIDKARQAVFEGENDVNRIKDILEEELEIESDNLYDIAYDCVYES